MGVAKGFSILLPTDTIPHLPRYDAIVGFSIMLPTVQTLSLIYPGMMLK